MPAFGRSFYIRSFAASVLLTGLAAAACAQSPFGEVVSGSDQIADEPRANERDLLDRLEAAERRIAELEAGQPLGGPGNSDSGSATLSNGTSGDKNGLAEQLNSLQQDWNEFQRTQQKEKQDARSKPTFDIGGRIQVDYWSFLEESDGIGYFEHPDADDPLFGVDPENRFLFRRIRLETEGTVPDLMFWRLQVDFNEPENPQMKDVYLGWELPDNRRLIVGHQKLPLSLDALYSSRFTTFMERPQVVDAFVTDYRRLGAMLYGNSNDLLFNWRYGIFETANIQDPGRYIGDSLQLGGYGRLASTPWYDEANGGRNYLHLGVAGSVVRPDGDVTDADSNDNVARFAARPEGRTDGRWIDTGPIRGAQWYQQMGLEAVINVGALQLTGEFMSTWVQRDSTTAGTGPDVNFHGGYVQAGYFLTGEHIPWDRESGTVDRMRPYENFFLVDRCLGGTGHGWGAWQIAARYDYLDLTDSDIQGGVENNLTLALNWWWNAYARLQFNVTRGLIEQHRRVGGFDSGDFWLAGTRFAIDF